MRKITTHVEARFVEQRIVDLGGCLEDTAEERDLVELQLAYEVWLTRRRGMMVVFPKDTDEASDMERDDATVWKD